MSEKVTLLFNTSHYLIITINENCIIPYNYKEHKSGDLFDVFFSPVIRRDHRNGDKTKTIVRFYK